MGFITNQWLKGNPDRNRGHYPVQVSMNVQTSEDEWSLERQVSCEIRVKKDDGEYQVLYFTTGELAEILPALTRSADSTVLKALAAETLRRLDDAAILAALKWALSKRVNS